MDPLQLLGMVLDLTDAVLGVLALVVLWYTWVMPAGKESRPAGSPLSGPTEIDRFLEEARTGTAAGAGHAAEEHVKGAPPRLPQR